MSKKRRQTLIADDDEHEIIFGKVNSWQCGVRLHSVNRRQMETISALMGNAPFLRPTEYSSAVCNPYAST